jgi:hypothetical protein
MPASKRSLVRAVLAILISSISDQEASEESTKERWRQEELIATVRESEKST